MPDHEALFDRLLDDLVWIDLTWLWHKLVRRDANARASQKLESLFDRKRRSLFGIFLPESNLSVDFIRPTGLFWQMLNSIYAPLADATGMPVDHLKVSEREIEKEREKVCVWELCVSTVGSLHTRLHLVSVFVHSPCLLFLFPSSIAVILTSFTLVPALLSSSLALTHRQTSFFHPNLYFFSSIRAGTISWLSTVTLRLYLDLLGLRE